MPEAGGPTAQAGFNYQDKIAALFLGDLLRADGGGADQVVEVRVEALGAVDDIVVTRADGRRSWMQAKHEIKRGGAAWNDLWLGLLGHLTEPEFGNLDEIVLVVGTDGELGADLAAAAKRTHGPDEADWRVRLTERQAKVIAAVEKAISGSAFPLFRRLIVQQMTPEGIERAVGGRMPESDATALSLWTALGAIAKDGAEIRELFKAPSLRTTLREKYRIEVRFPTRWKLEAYLHTVRSVTISVPGTNVGARADEAFHWPHAVRASDVQSDFDDEQAFDRGSRAPADIDLQIFPAPQLFACIVHAGPGMGKTALLRALASRLASEGAHVPAVIDLAPFSEADAEVGEWLAQLNRQYAVDIDWRSLCETGEVAVFFDGLDEVTTEKRALVAQRLDRFNRRFPTVPWMLTVRDPAVVPVGFEAQKIELLPLDRDGMRALAALVRPDLEKVDIARMTAQTEAYPDLERLVRIPLFLALVAAMWTPGDDIPSRRQDLIEAYLKTLFRPEEHKPAQRARAPRAVRVAAEALAFRLLEQGKIGASERDVRGAFASIAYDDTNAEDVFDDALRCGILRRSQGGHLSFPFPIVQEYLAAARLAAQGEEAIIAQLHLAAQRPWAQSIQFALEHLADASGVVEALLAHKDDAFVTGLRLVARCILNGMRVSLETRAAVGDSLVKSWRYQSWDTQRRIGRMLLDGWTQPPSKSLMSALHHYDLSHGGAEDILVDLADDELTLSVLATYLKAPRHPANLGRLQTRVTAHSRQAFELYLATAHRAGADAEMWAIATLVSRLDGAEIGEAALKAASEDETLAPEVRLAAWGLRKNAPLDQFWSLALPSLQAGTPASTQWAAIRAIAATQDRWAILSDMIRRHDFPDATKENIVDHARDVLGDAVRAWLLVEGSADDVSASLRLRIQITAACLGDGAVFVSIIQRMGALEGDDVARVLRLVNLFQDAVSGAQIESALRVHVDAPADRVRVISALLMGATHTMESVGYDFAALNPSRPHPHYPAFVQLLADWRAEGGFDLPDQMRIEIEATRAGLPGAADRLFQLTRSVALNEDLSGHENPFEWSMRNALDELSRQRIWLDLSTLQHVVDHAESNARIGALYHIGAMGSREALEYLLARHRADREYRSIIFSAIERIAGRLGVKVARTDDGLTIHE